MDLKGSTKNFGKQEDRIMNDSLYRDMKMKLDALGQSRLLRFYDELSDGERLELLTQIRDMDFSYLDHFKEKDSPQPASLVEPLPAMTLAEIEAEKDMLREPGIRALKNGQVAAVLLAGGMGTRLGTDGPKGTCNIGITRPVYIFQRLTENLLLRVRECGRWIHLFIMTSEVNDEATRQFFLEHDYFGYRPEYVRFFRQDMAPAVDDAGNVLLETKSRVAASPNGNGGWFRSLDRAGLTSVLRDEGILYLNVFAVDNVLQNICDPVFIGAVLKSGYPAGSKVVRKQSAEEKVGVMCRKDGCASVIEYYEMTEDMLHETDEQGNRLYNFGVILNYLFRVEDLAASMNASMPLHFANKKIPHIDAEGRQVSPASPNGWKFEYFIFDILACLKNCLPFEVERSREFAPIKNREGVDSIESARELCALNGIEL